MSTRPGVRSVLLRDGVVVAQAGADPDVPWWSVGKTVLAAAALVLADRGALALDAPCPGQPYSLRHLLQHTSGLPDYGGLRAYHEAVARGDEPWSLDDLRQRAGAAALRTSPGAAFAYSNIGYREVADLVATAAGLPLADALSNLVLMPCDAGAARLALTRDDLSGVEMGTAAGYHPGWVYHGLIVGPLADAARTVDGILSGRLFGPDLVAEMTRPRLLTVDVAGRPWTAPGYGFGVMAGRWGALDVSGHTGGGPGSVCAVYTASGAGHRLTGAAFQPGGDADAIEHGCAALLDPKSN